MKCLGCHRESVFHFLWLGYTYLANSLWEINQKKEAQHPLSVGFCTSCYLVQLEYLVEPKILYKDYVYYSSNSTTFLEHTKAFVGMLEEEYGLGIKSKVLEIASNDGYLLQYLKPTGAGILGIEPATNLAAAANVKGLPTMEAFFGPALVPTILREYGKSDIIIGNNVLAHVPDINEFIRAVGDCLASDGMATFEFPYVLSLLDNLEFDTIYHEHVFYYSVIALKKLFARQQMEIFDIKFSTIHGGSLRIFIKHKSNRRPINSVVSFYELNELSRGLIVPNIYVEFSNAVETATKEIHDFCQKLKSEHKSIAAYGAPAKGNTLLNCCALDGSILDFTVDISPAKQGRFLPGSFLRIFPPEYLLEKQPDYTLLLSWNFADEIKEQQRAYLRRGGKFIVPIPTPKIIGA